MTLFLSDPDHFQAGLTKDGDDILRIRRRSQIFLDLFTFFTAFPTFTNFCGKTNSAKMASKIFNFSVENGRFLPNGWKRHPKFNEIRFSWSLAKKRDQELRGTWRNIFCRSKSLMTTQLFGDFFKKCQNSM